MPQIAEGLRMSAAGIDLTGRLGVSTTVVASPAAAVETIIAQVAIPANLTIVSGVLVVAFAAFTVGANGTGANLKVRQTNAAGATVVASGAVTETAANLDELAVVGFDASPNEGQLYVATLTVPAGTAQSTVSAVTLAALAV